MRTRGAADLPMMGNLSTSFLLIVSRGGFSSSCTPISVRGTSCKEPTSAFGIHSSHDKVHEGTDANNMDTDHH